MGQRRRQRDDDRDTQAQVRVENDRERHAECLRRWPGIVGAIRSLIAAYNDGAGAEVVSSAEGCGDAPTLIITSQHPPGETLTIAVDDGDLSVHTMSGAARPAAGLHGGVRRIDCSRTDMATAAYLVQDWMARI